MSAAAVEMDESHQIPEALATGLLATDASRRVGWAKAFEALRRVDSLEEDTRQLRDELTALRRAYSRLCGFVQTIPVQHSPVFDAEIKSHFAAERSFRHEDAFEKGVAVAQEHQAHLEQWTEEDMLKRRERKSDKSRAYAELFAAAEAMGHITARERTLTRYARSCSCGWELASDGPADSTEERRLNRALHEHVCQSVHGFDTNEFDRRRKLAATTDEGDRAEQPDTDGAA